MMAGGVGVSRLLVCLVRGATGTTKNAEIELQLARYTGRKVCNNALGSGLGEARVFRLGFLEEATSTEGEYAIRGRRALMNE